MPLVTTLCQLSGAYVNLEYTFLNGKKVKLLDDTKIYLGCQVENRIVTDVMGLLRTMITYLYASMGVMEQNLKS